MKAMFRLRRWLCLCLGFSLALFSYGSSANELQLMEAINAVMMGNPSPAQQALVVFKNKQINQMSLRGEISNLAYQSSQKHFSQVNNSLIRGAAAKGGLRASLQPSAGGNFNPGTDTDVLVEALERGKKINLDNIRMSEEAYQKALRAYLEDRGVKPPSGKINTETDFMPTRSSVTDAEFVRINKHINANGGTAYIRPGAAEIEFQMRTVKNNPEIKLNLHDTGDYVSEMHDLADHKFKLADELEQKAQKLKASDPRAANALTADAQLARSQGAKYLQRIDDVSDQIGKQYGLAPTKPPTNASGEVLARDSLDDAIHNIGKKGRGVATADDAAMLGELGQMGVGKGLRNYTQTLARLAASDPSIMQDIQRIIAEQAASLPPTKRDALILHLVKEYQAAGGKPHVSRAFGRELRRLAEAAPARPARLGAAGGGALPSSAGAAATARITGVVGGALTVATVYLDYQACIDAGKPAAQCDEELQHTLATTALTGVGMMATAKGLIAAGIISQSTLIAVGGGLALFGAPLSFYAAYSAGINWAEAPEKTALTKQYAMEKDRLMDFGRSASQAQAELDLMQTLLVRSASMCMQLSQRGEAAQHLM